jgi:NADH-quinone oxidoreductase subunit L
MHALEELFPASDFTLIAFIVLLPLLGAAVNGVFGKRLGREAVTLMGLGSVLVSFLFSVVTFFILHHQGEEGATKLVWRGWQWMSLSLHGGGATSLWVSLSVDALSGTMALIVTGIGFLIHLYSSKYMEDDPGFYRFFTYLNLFIFSMLVLILGDSLPVLFVGWEGVGLCSYLLIGFWFGEEKNAAAGKKAFITNRIGDFGLLVAMGLLLYYCGALDWSGIEAARGGLLQQVPIWPLGDHVPLANLLPEGAATWLNTPRQVSAATLVCLFLFLGAAGKSAQLPLYVWLPDAMAGPTPVSALIHAATMVTAGIYLVCRTSAIFVMSPAAMFVVAFTGGLTALLAASIAFAQNDIKKVLAYSTVSQLGYMFLGVGVGAFSAGFFHVITHAFFKACMFLGAGSVIHAMHARIHDTDASQDMRNMGGLRKYMPYTFLTFAASWAAIIGIPGTSGFFSKDEILLKAYTSYIQTSNVPDSFEWPKWGGTALYAMGFAGAIMTAFYMTRLFIGIFFGDFKGWDIVKKWKEPAHEHGDHHHHHDPDEKLEGPEPHESPWQMWVPLAILGTLALFGGVLNAGALEIIGVHWLPLDGFLEPVFKNASASVKMIEDGHHMLGTFLGLALAAVAVGAGGAYYIYVSTKGELARAFTEKFPGLHQLVYDKWRIDELYEETVIGAVDSLAEFGAWADKWIVDGILAKLSAFLVRGTGSLLRQLHTGRIQAYAAVMVVGLGAVGWFLVAPHANAKVVANHASGAYSVTATPGLGYSYRWNENGDKVPENKEFTNQDSVSFNLENGSARVVSLEVKNAFGQVAKRKFELQRPKVDMSGVIDVTRGANGQLQGTPRPQQPSQPGRPNAPPILPGSQVPAGHPAIPQGE